MKTKTTLTVLLSFLLFGLANAEPSGKSNTKTKSLPPTKRSLPAGWFNQGDLPSVLVGERPADVQPAAHFDAPVTRKKNTKTGKSVAQRLRSAQNAVIYSDLNEPATTVDLAPGAENELLRPVDGTTFSLQPSSQQSLPRKPSPTNEVVDVPFVVGTSNVKSDITAPAGPGIAPVQPPIDVQSANNHTIAPTESGEDAVGVFDLEASIPSGGTSDSLFSAPPVAEVAVGASSDGADPEPTDDTGIQKPIPDRLSSVVTRSSMRQPIERESEAILEPSDSAIVETDRPSTPLAAQPIRTGDPVDRSELVARSSDAGDVLISNQNPVILVETRGPRTIVVGKPAAYSLVVRNASDNDAKDVVVNLNVPTWTEVQSHDATVGTARLTPDDRGNTVMRWTIGKLPASGKQTLKLRLVPRSSRPFDLGVTWSFNPVRSRAQIEVQEPKLDLTVVGPADVMYGEKKVYTLTVSNPGTGDAENVAVQLLPFIPNEEPAVREIGTLRPGERRTLEVELKARQTGRLQVRAEAVAANGLRARGQQDVFVRRANIQVQVEAPEMKYAGSRAVYRIRVTNSGDAVASDVIAVATLPNGATEVRTKANGVVSDSLSEIHWELGTLRPGAVRLLEFACTLTKAGENRVDVRSVAADNLSAVQTARTNVESLADLKLTVDDPKGAIATGAEVVYEVRVTNRGTKEAKNISMVGYFSEGIEPTAISGWTGKVMEGQVQLDHINRLGSGQEVTIKITAVASRPGNHVFRAELNCNNPETRLASEEWTRFYGDGIQVLNAAKPGNARR